MTSETLDRANEIREEIKEIEKLLREEQYAYSTFWLEDFVKGLFKIKSFSYTSSYELEPSEKLRKKIIKVIEEEKALLEKELEEL